MQDKITQTLVDRVKREIRDAPLAKPREYRDPDLKGFILRVQPSGVMSYVVQVARGKRLTVGKVPLVTPKRAREKAKVALGAAADGRDPKGALRVDDGESTPTLRAYVDDTYSGWIIANRKTGAELVQRIKACFFADFGETPLDRITLWNAEKWRKARIHQGRTVGTINKDLKTLKAALERAVEWELVEKNPLAKLKPGKEDRLGVVRYLSPDEEQRLRDALAGRDAALRAGRERANEWRRRRGVDVKPALGTYPDHLTPLVLVAINTGLRQGELFNLTWSDVDLDRGSLTVRGSGAKSGTTRHVPLNAEARAVLKAWREQTAGEVLVFESPKGGRLDNVQTSWERLVKAAGISAFRFHDTRHHFASRLVMAGVDLNTVRELLGHSDLTMTLRYAHLAPEHKAAAVEKLVTVGTVTPIQSSEVGA